MILLVVSRLLCPPTNWALYAATLAFLGLLAWNNIHWLLYSVAKAQTLF
jgi:hypothetical protein